MHEMRAAVSHRTILISDLHLGSYRSDAVSVLDFLSRHRAETLFLVGDVIDPILMRVTLEKVDGEYQGAVYPFMRRDELKGSNRLLFHADGPLYIGTTDRGWSRGSTGLQRITWTGRRISTGPGRCCWMR